MYSLLPGAKMAAEHILIQRLDANDPAVVIHVPNGHGIGGIVYPGFAVVPVRFRKDIFRELLALGIEPEISATLQFSAPYLTVLVGHGLI